MASLNEIISISVQSRDLLNNTDIFCPVKKPPNPVKRVTRRTAQPGEVAPIWPLTGETRKPEHVLQQQTIQRQRQPQKFVVQAKAHAPMQPPEPEVPIEAQKPDEALVQVRHSLTPENPFEQETEVPELLQVPIVTPQPKQMAPEQPLPHVLPMPRLMPLPAAIPKVPDQLIPYQSLMNPRALDIRLLGNLPDYDNDIDDEKEVSIRHPD